MHYGFVQRGINEVGGPDCGVRPPYICRVTVIEWTRRGTVDYTVIGIGYVLVGSSDDNHVVDME